MSWVGLGKAGGRRSWTVRHGGRVFAVFLVEERCYVTDARCPHNGGPLAQGWILRDRELVCPWHGYAYDLETGQCRTAADYRLGCYPVQERDGRFYANLPGPAPRLSWTRRLRVRVRRKPGPPAAPPVGP